MCVSHSKPPSVTQRKAGAVGREVDKREFENSHRLTVRLASPGDSQKRHSDGADKYNETNPIEVSKDSKLSLVLMEQSEFWRMVAEEEQYTRNGRRDFTDVEDPSPALLRFETKCNC
jgi:hypothetical protein